jgi:hypothetical protein
MNTFFAEMMAAGTGAFGAGTKEAGGLGSASGPLGSCADRVETANINKSAKALHITALFTKAVMMITPVWKYGDMEIGHPESPLANHNPVSHRSMVKFE